LAFYSTRVVPLQITTWTRFGMIWLLVRLQEESLGVDSIVSRSRKTRPRGTEEYREMNERGVIYFPKCVFT
jgi:hypothetical protein